MSGDYRAEKIGAKIRDAQLQLVPYMLVVGGREMDSGQVSLRDRIEGDLGPKSVDEAIEMLSREAAARTVRQTFGGDAGLGETAAGHEY